MLLKNKFYNSMIFQSEQIVEKTNDDKHNFWRKNFSVLFICHENRIPTISFLITIPESGYISSLNEFLLIKSKP